MIFKLLKFELKNSYRIFLLLYAMILISSLFVNFTSDSVAVFGIIYTILMVTLIIITIVNVVRNYAKSMFSRESYLTHTLPVAEWKVLLVKTIAAAIWIAITTFVIMVSSLIVAWRALTAYSTSVQFNGLELSFTNMMQIFYMTISLFEGILLLYFIMTVVHTNLVPRYRTAVGFVLFFIISYVISFISEIIPGMSGNGTVFSLNNTYSYISEITTTQSSSIVMMTGFQLLLAIIFFAGTVYVLKNKLEIE